MSSRDTRPERVPDATVVSSITPSKACRSIVGELRRLLPLPAFPAYASIGLVAESGGEEGQTKKLTYGGDEVFPRDQDL